MINFSLRMLLFSRPKFCFSLILTRSYMYYNLFLALNNVFNEFVTEISWIMCIPYIECADCHALYESMYQRITHCWCLISIIYKKNEKMLLIKIWITIHLSIYFKVQISLETSFRSIIISWIKKIHALL